jgi:hypothetical protein
MPRRPLLWLTIAGLAGLGALALLRPAPPRPGAGVTRENFSRIRVGMTEAEVEAVFRCPPGDYSRQGWTVAVIGEAFPRWWVTDEAVVTVLLEPEDESDRGKPLRVKSMTFEPLPRETFWERCRRLAPW